MSDLILALDAGTSVMKAVAFTTAGAEVAVAARPNEYEEGPGGRVEQDMGRTARDARAALSELAEKIDGHTPVALAVTGQGDGTWLADADGDPVAPAMLWLDSRAGPIVDALRAGGAAEATYAFTGTGLAACQQSAQLLWLARHRPELLARAATALHCKDWLYLTLTGERATDPSEACFTFGDWRERDYSPEVLTALGCGGLQRLLPPIVDGTSVSHPLSASAALATGLPAGLPVVLGSMDVMCTGLGCGLFGGNAEVGVSILGSTGMHMRALSEPAEFVRSEGLTGYCVLAPGASGAAQVQTHMAASLNIDWVADLARQSMALLGESRSRAQVVAALDALVDGARPAAALFHPFISTAGERGPFTDTTARASLLGLDRSVGLGELARAVFEGVGFAARDCYEAIGGPPAEIRIAGGAAKATSMKRILAACLDRPVVCVAQPEAGAAGAAMMAAVNRGLYDGIGRAVDAWIGPLLQEPVLPDPALTRLYAAHFPLYRSTYAALPSFWHRLHAVREAAHAA